MKKVMKRLLCVAVASVVLLSSELGVSAAGLKDIFDAEYYAEQYPDLKSAFGNNEKALYQHFLTYGIKEGRVMNPIIDVVKYREQYGDLQKAFGNNWDAYVKHYFAFGVNEHRENGTDFDLLAYLEAYGDVKEAYGNDYVAVAKHYAEIGMSEGRNEGSKELIAERERAEAEENEEESEDVNENEDTDTSEDFNDVEDTDTSEEEDVVVSYEKKIVNEDGTWYLEQYDDRDALLKRTKYNSEDKVLYYSTFKFDENFILRERITYSEDLREEKAFDQFGLPTIDRVFVLENGEEKLATAISKYDGQEKIYEYDEATGLPKLYGKKLDGSGEGQLDVEYDEATKTLKYGVRVNALRAFYYEYKPNGMVYRNDVEAGTGKVVETTFTDAKRPSSVFEQIK